MSEKKKADTETTTKKKTTKKSETPAAETTTTKKKAAEKPAVEENNLTTSVSKKKATGTADKGGATESLKKTESTERQRKSKTKTSSAAKEGGETATAATEKKKKKTTAEDEGKKPAEESKKSAAAAEENVQVVEQLKSQITEKESLVQKLNSEKESLIKDQQIAIQKINEGKDKEIEDIKKKYEEEIAKLKQSVLQPEQAPKIEDSDAITTDPKTGKIVKINGEWKGISAGGAFDKLSWRYNPQIFIRPSRSCEVEITLTQPQAGTYAKIGWYIFQAETEMPRRLLIASEEDILAKSGFHKEKEVVKKFSLKKVKEPYILLPCTLDSGEECSFSVTLSADAPLTAQLISKEQEWPQPTILGEWATETAGGYHKYETSTKNPQYLLKVEKQAPIKVLLLQEKFEEFENIGLYIISIDPDRKQKLTERSDLTNKEKQICLPKFEDPNVASFSWNAKPGSYAIIPCTYEPGALSTFKLMVMTEDLMPPIKELADAACIQINGDWQGETAGGCLNDIRSWRQNVQYLLSVKSDIEVSIKVKQTSASGGTGEIASVGFYIFSGGRRVIIPKKKNIYHKSKFVKSSDGALEKLKLAATGEPYIFVPCTHAAGQEGAYTVQIFSDNPGFTEIVSLEPLPQDRDRERFVSKGEWSETTAGGCLNYSTWRNNPQFLLEIGKSTEVVIFLSCKSESQDINPGFYLVNAPNTTNLRVKLKPEEVIAKAAFRQDTEVHKTLKLEPGRYNIIPCTYKSGQQSKFEVSVWSSDFGVVELKPIPAGILSMKGSWTAQTAGGCINDIKSWWNNPHFYLAVKQDIELVAVLIQSPGEAVDENNLLDIGMYITNSDGDGNPKTNEEKDLISKAAFSPDRDVVSTCTVPSSYWPYVITPCTFKPGVLGKFEIQLVMDQSALEYLEFSKENIVINPAEVVGAGEDPEMREIRKRFKPLAARCLELVQLTETSTTLPEYFKYIGRTLLQTVSQFQDSIVAWGENKEPDWWLAGYEEEYVEEPAEPQEGGGAPPPPPPSGAPPPPPKAPPVINFSKPVKSKMVDNERTSNMTKEMIDELETKKTHFVDELLQAVQGGIKALRKVEIPPKPVVEDPTVCAFNIEILNKRRAALEGLNDKEETWSDNEEWND